VVGLQVLGEQAAVVTKYYRGDTGVIQGCSLAHIPRLPG
jgi:hypothetical protein